MSLLFALPLVKRDTFSKRDLVQLGQSNRSTIAELNRAIFSYRILHDANVEHASHLIASDFLLPTEQMHLSAVNKSFYERALDCWQDQTLDAGELRQLQMVYMQHLQVDFCLDASACATCDLWVEFADSAYRSTGICSPCRRTLRNSGIAHAQKLQQCSGLNLTGLDIALEWLQISGLRKCIRFERVTDFRRARNIATGRLALSNPFR